MNNSAPIALIFINKPFREIYICCLSINFFCGDGCGKEWSVGREEGGGYF